MPRDTVILGPVIALVVWTFAILLLLAFRRVRAGLSGQVHIREFALGESDKVPVRLVLANRNYMNLLELPVLFYLGSLILLILGSVNVAQLALAWSYVALRILHSLIHVNRNRVVYRFYAFLFSNVALLAFWALIVQQVLR
jgi:hypothetical protein